MAVKQRSAGMIGGELHLGGALGWDKEDVLHQSSHIWPIADMQHLKSMAMQMDRMIVGAEVLHH